ncbi:MAG: hypothetical protein ACREEM_35855, partial [Blastocatellia bacterium]
MRSNVLTVTRKSSSDFSKRLKAGLRQFLIGFLLCSLVTQSVLADTITYQQLQQETSGRTRTVTTTPAVARNNEGQDPLAQTTPRR